MMRYSALSVYDCIFLVMGASGSGKTTFVGNLMDRHPNLKAVSSYTTRPKRSDNEQGHIFVDDAHFPKEEDWVAYTNYNGYQYCATWQQVNECNFYVIDPAGVDEFMKRYRGEKVPIVIGLNVPLHARITRMLERGDSEEDITSRTDNDKQAFANAAAHIWLHNRHEEEAVDLFELICTPSALARAASTERHKKPNTVFLSGPVSGVKDYKETFGLYERRLQERGYITLSPTILPERGFTYDQYMAVNKAMLDECDIVVFLPGWNFSKGSSIESIYARENGMPCYDVDINDKYGLTWLPHDD